MVEIKFVKTHDSAIIPTRNHENLQTQKAWKSIPTQILHDDPILPYEVEGTHDSGWDLFSVEETAIAPSETKIVQIGLQLAYITPGYWFRIESRSGLSFKHSVLAHPGIIDNQYRGDLAVCMYNHGSEKYYNIKIGDKIAQLVIYPLIDGKMSFTDKLTETVRANKGHGSSGR